MSTIKLGTGVCLHCKQEGSIEMSEDEYNRGINAFNEGELIQCAFPGLSVDQREQIISGTHPQCWDELFAEKED